MSHGSGQFYTDFNGPLATNFIAARATRSVNVPERTASCRSELILVIILVIFLLGGFSGRFGGYGYGYGHGGVGLIGIILIILVILLLMGRL